MIKAKCIEKIRDNNNIIIGYVLMDNDGKTIKVEPKQLKDAIASRKIDIINLKLTKDNKLMDRNISESIDSYGKMSSTSEVDVDKVNLKAQIIGSAPITNDRGVVVDLAISGRTVFSDSTQVIGISKFSNTEAMFTGSKELIKYYWNHSKCFISFDSIVVANPCIMKSLLAKSTNDVMIEASKILISHSLVDIKTVDEIFKILKNKCTNWADKFCQYIAIDENIARNIGFEEIYNRTHKILNRQKVSDKPSRRLYDILVYLQFINSMYISTGQSDDRFLLMANSYEAELSRLLYNYSDNDAVHRIACARIIREVLPALKQSLQLGV